MISSGNVYLKYRGLGLPESTQSRIADRHIEETSRRINWNQHWSPGSIRSPRGMGHRAIRASRQATSGAAPQKHGAQRLKPVRVIARKAISANPGVCRTLTSCFQIKKRVYVHSKAGART